MASQNSILTVENIQNNLVAIEEKQPNILTFTDTDIQIVTVNNITPEKIVITQEKNNIVVIENPTPNNVIVTDTEIQILAIGVMGLKGDTGANSLNTYSISEEYYTYAPSITLLHSPVFVIPMTVSVNGLILHKSEYHISQNTLVTNPLSAVSEDMIRIVYAYGGI